MKLVYIEWGDAISNSEWKTEKEAKAWAKTHDWLVKHVGWVIEENEKFICLAGRWVPESNESVDQFGNLQKIPKTWIKRRVNLTKFIKEKR